MSGRQALEKTAVWPPPVLTAWKPQQYCAHGEKILAPRASSARGRVSSECQQRALDTDAHEGFIHNCQILRQQSCPSKHVLPKCLVTGQTNRATSHRGRLFRAKKKWAGTSLVVQWLRLGAPSAGGQGLTLGQELAPTLPQLKFLPAVTKIWDSQINKYIYI